MVRNGWRGLFLTTAMNDDPNIFSGRLFCDMLQLFALFILFLSILALHECAIVKKITVRKGLYPLPVDQVDGHKISTDKNIYTDPDVPSADPSTMPSEIPTVDPSLLPTPAPTIQPTEEPTPEPTLIPTVAPSEEPTAHPTESPSADPTESPTVDPTVSPTAPTAEPSLIPTLVPSAHPTLSPTGPSPAPSGPPSPPPTTEPTVRPTRKPTLRPTRLPSADPTITPTIRPTGSPSNPTARPSTASPTLDIVAIQFTSDLTFINMVNETMSESDADTVSIAAALSMSVNSKNVTYLAQSSVVQVRRPAYWNAKYWSLSTRRLLTQYTIVVTVSTLVYLPRATTPTAYYNTLTTRLNSAVSTATFLNYLRLFETGFTFESVDISDITVINNALVLAGAPTFAPTQQPTYNLPRRMANAPLIGTVLGAFFGSLILAYLIYRTILHMREKREDREYMNTRKLMEVVEKEVFLPREIEDGVPLPLEPVRKHTLQRDIAAKLSGTPKTGVVQIVFESDQL